MSFLFIEMNSGSHLSDILKYNVLPGSYRTVDPIPQCDRI